MAYPCAEEEKLIRQLRAEVSRLTAELTEAKAMLLQTKQRMQGAMANVAEYRTMIDELRAQEPVFWVREEVVKLSMRGVRFGGERTSPRKDDEDGLTFPVFIRPIPAAQAVPDGWQLVPKEPTRGMYSAAMRESDDRWLAEPKLNAAYRAMLAAAPQLPVSDGDAKEPS